MNRKTAPQGAAGDIRPQSEKADCPVAATTKTSLATGKFTHLQATSPSAPLAKAPAPLDAPAPTAHRTTGDRLRRAAARPRDRKAQEAAALAQVRAVVATFDTDTVEEALYEVEAFARAYRGTSEAMWVHYRAHMHAPTMFDEREHHGADEEVKTALRFTANALYWHPLRQLVDALCVATLGDTPRAIADQLGESDGESESRDVRRALRVCRRVRTTIGGAK